MFENIRIYRIDNGRYFRIMAVYMSGSTFEGAFPANTEPLSFKLPATGKGDPELTVTITSQKVEDDN